MNKYELAKSVWQSYQKEWQDAMRQGMYPSTLKFMEDRCVEAYEIMKRYEDESV